MAGRIDPGPASIEFESNCLAETSRHGLGCLGGLLRLFVINKQTREVTSASLSCRLMGSRTTDAKHVAA
jgi:hypothetical protein